MNSIQICLDTNIWIGGLISGNLHCIKILNALSQFQVILPNQIRAELARNFDERHLRLLFRIFEETHVEIDYSAIPYELIMAYKQKGLKKGAAIIGAFCEYRQISILVSENRHFLREVSDEKSFKVIFAQTFCEFYLQHHAANL